MEYSINKLARLAGVSTRALRYYDEIGLLKPTRVNSAGYRIYGKKEVDMLQQILFYRELGVALDKIKEIVTKESFDMEAALNSHLTSLRQKREQIDTLIEIVEKTISEKKGKLQMSDKEKFEGFKQKLIDDNEEKYGAEIREKYGEKSVAASNAKIKGMTKEQYESIEALRVEVNESLKAAMENGNPAGELAQKACELHKKWLCFYWDGYSKEAHIGLTQMYVDDERFKAYYVENVGEGAAEFLRDAVKVYCS